MQNPWLHLPSEAPFVLEEEREIIDAFNRHYPDAQTRIRTDILPEPYLGNPDSNVVVLSLNPCFDETDLQWHANVGFADCIKANLRHEPQYYPFYPLNPNFSGSGAYTWWHKKLKELIKDVSLEKVAKNLFCVEWFPYHSVSYRVIPKSVSSGIIHSQRYAGALVEAAIKRGASIVAMRHYKGWVKLVPSLQNYSAVYHLNSPQSANLSSVNIPGYWSLVQAVGGD
jgi:hypothetical protein